MLEIIDLSEWKTKEQILKEYHDQGIGMKERTFRKLVEMNNKCYYDHTTEWFIAHGNKGYIKTKDAEIINKSIEDGKKRALNLLWKYSRTKKALGEKDNLRLELERMDIIDGR